MSAGRFLGRGRVLALVAIGLLAVLDPPDREVSQDATVSVAVHTHGGVDATVTVVRQADRWVGTIGDFPTGSVADILPRGSPGFFLVRVAGETFRAYADRSPESGQSLEYRDPLVSTLDDADGPQPGFYDPDVGASYTLDGEAFLGPASRPLDPFPLVVEADRWRSA